MVVPELIGTSSLRPLALSRSPPHPLDELWRSGQEQQRIADGRTTIGPIPAGAWTVSVEVEPGRVVERTVSVAPDQRVRIELD